MCQPFSGQWMMLVVFVGSGWSSFFCSDVVTTRSCVLCYHCSRGTVYHCCRCNSLCPWAERLDQWECPGHLWGSTAVHSLTQQRPRLSSAQGKSWPGALRGKGSLGAPWNPNSAACWASCVIPVIRAYVAHNIRPGLGQLNKNERRPLQFQGPDLSVSSAFSFLCSVYQHLLVFSQSLTMSAWLSWSCHLVKNVYTSFQISLYCKTFIKSVYLFIFTDLSELHLLIVIFLS